MTVIEPPPFTWLSSRSTPGSEPELTRVVGIDQVGTEFMRSVFALQSGQVGLAMNQPGKIIYVVHLLTYTPGEETLWKLFADEAANPNTLSRLFSVQRLERTALVNAWYADLEKNAGLHWEREPFETRGGGSSDD